MSYSLFLIMSSANKSCFLLLVLVVLVATDPIGNPSEPRGHHPSSHHFPYHYHSLLLTPLLSPYQPLLTTPPHHPSSPPLLTTLLTTPPKPPKGNLSDQIIQRTAFMWLIQTPCVLNKLQFSTRLYIYIISFSRIRIGDRESRIGGTPSRILSRVWSP